MEKDLFKYSLRWAVAAVCLGTTITSTSAGSFTRARAMRDLDVLMLIEERESSNAISAEKLSDAVITMLNARIICNEGRVTDA